MSDSEFGKLVSELIDAAIELGEHPESEQARGHTVKCEGRLIDGLNAIKIQRDEALAMVKGLSFVCGECRWCGGMFGNCAADCRLDKLLREVSNG